MRHTHVVSTTECSEGQWGDKTAERLVGLLNAGFELLRKSITHCPV
ncbi:hypothetical protein ACVXHA_02285 [Escherichia coli]